MTPKKEKSLKQTWTLTNSWNLHQASLNDSARGEKLFFFSHINITQFKCSQFTIVFCQHLWEKKSWSFCAKHVIKTQRVSHRHWPLDPPKHAFKMLTVIPVFGCTRMVAVSKWTTSACCFPSGRVCPDFTLGEPTDQTCTHTCTDVPLNSINNNFSPWIASVLSPSHLSSTSRLLFLLAIYDTPPPHPLNLWLFIRCLKKLNNSFDLSGKTFPPLWQPKRRLAAPSECIVDRPD